LWSFKGAALRKLAEELPSVASRLHGAQALHRLDSFFSMNETTQTLNAGMRDEILACMTGHRRAEANELLNVPGEVPAVVYLISDGHVIFSPDEGNERITFGPDQFIGLRDALHALPTDGAFIAQESCRLLEFDAEKLRNYAADAPPDVIAVFERLG
jgi:CRP-like cAMP-binding protein